MFDYGNSQIDVLIIQTYYAPYQNCIMHTLNVQVVPYLEISSFLGEFFCNCIEFLLSNNKLLSKTAHLAVHIAQFPVLNRKSQLSVRITKL